MALLLDRIIEAPNDVLLGRIRLNVFQILGNGLARDGQAIAV